MNMLLRAPASSSDASPIAEKIKRAATAAVTTLFPRYCLQRRDCPLVVAGKFREQTLARAAAGTPTPDRLMAQELFQLVNFISQARIARNLILDLADRVQNRRMIAIAEAPADLGQ